MKNWFLVGAALPILISSGCGPVDSRGVGVDAAVETSSEVGEVEVETAAPDGDIGSPDGETSTPDAEVAQDTVAPALRNACDDADPCSSGVCRSGVCVIDPPSGAASHITDPVTNLASSDWPDLGCADQTFVAPAQTTTATLYGAVARFGKGRKTTGIHVSVMLAEGFDPSACNDLPTTDAIKTCYRNYGTPIGTNVSIAATPSSVPSECLTHEQCPLGYQCFDPSELGGACEEQFGLYEITNVPLDTPLIIRSYATTSEAQWHDTWMFNIVLHSERVVDGRVQYDAQMVSEGQWQLTTNTVGLPPMDVKNGAVGGRVRDCGDARDDWPVADVRLGLAAPGKSIVYFNNLEDDTVPLIDRETTDILGRFAALDVPAGWNRIAGAARVDGQVVTVGGAPVYVVPNSLSIVSWPGTEPYWRQR